MATHVGEESARWNDRTRRQVRTTKPQGRVVKLVAATPAKSSHRSIFSSLLMVTATRPRGALNERGIPSPDAPRRTSAHRAGRLDYGDGARPPVESRVRRRCDLNVRSMPKFHRLQDNEIREVDEFEANSFR